MADNILKLKFDLHLWVLALISSLHFMVEPLKHFQDFKQWLTSKMVDNIMADQRCSPKVSHPYINYNFEFFMFLNSYHSAISSKVYLNDRSTLNSFTTLCTHKGNMDLEKSICNILSKDKGSSTKCLNVFSIFHFKIKRLFKLQIGIH